MSAANHGRSFAVPVLELPPLPLTVEAEARLGAVLLDACRDIAMFAISGPCLDLERIGEAARITRAFFDLPLQAKQAVVATDGAGYRPVPTANLAATAAQDGAPGDLKETFNVLKASERNRWPTAPNDMRGVLTRYLCLCDELAATLLRSMLRALGRAGETDQVLAEDASVLRLVNYPSPEPQFRLGDFRCEPHTDYGALSVLLPENSDGGLQVRVPSGEWVDSPTPADTLVVQVGDFLERFTGGTIRAVLHRVRNPPATTRDTRRQSLVFFQNPSVIRAQVERYIRS